MTRDKFWMFVLLSAFLTGILTAVLIPERYVMQMIDAERESNYSFLGYDTARHTEGRAERWFERLFIRTGMMDATYQVTTSDRQAPSGNAAEKHMEKALDWLEGRVRVLWVAMFQLLVRISVALMWLPLALLIFTPFVIDALVSRRIKANSFAITSPHLHAIGARALFWIALGYGVLQLLPLKLHPVWTPTFIGVTAMAAWLGISQFAKRA